MCGGNGEDEDLWARKDPALTHGEADKDCDIFVPKIEKYVYERKRMKALSSNCTLFLCRSFILKYRKEKVYNTKLLHYCPFFRQNDQNEMDID